ncbi:MAG: serine hydroxymethyltransferase [Candidatus Woesearchaeota archaeon]|nr:MAG: serine hydroxymethyltransferase [Candidatus Woesearchaeota archaeon]
MVVNIDNLKRQDPKLAILLGKELEKQKNTVNLIASENYTSLPVLEATASVLTNKYSEGYPRARYYEGNEYIDEIEQLAIDRAKKLFGADHANVQALSGSPANMAVYMALLNLGDKTMAMNLDQGGHLTHGSKVSFSGKWYNFVHYSLSKETEMLDMDEIRKLAIKEKPKLIVCGASAYPRKIDFKAFRDIANEVGAYLVADIAHIAGLIAAEEHINSVPYADITTSTTQKTLRGPRSGLILCKEEYAKKVDSAVFPGISGGPHEHIIAAKAVAFKEAMQPEFKDYQRQVVENAKVLAQNLKDKGFRLISGGTDTHLVLVDLTNKGITGKQASEALIRANIIVNMNMIPFDKRTPRDPSGIRLGTPALTTRGFKDEEIAAVAEGIDIVLSNMNNNKKIEKVKEDIIDLCKKFPIYPELNYEGR